MPLLRYFLLLSSFLKSDLKLGGTDTSGSGRYLNETRDGIYDCVVCSKKLFESSAKFKHCGWPSFDRYEITLYKAIENILELSKKA